MIATTNPQEKRKNYEKSSSACEFIVFHELARVLERELHPDKFWKKIFLLRSKKKRRRKISCWYKEDAMIACTLARQETQSKLERPHFLIETRFILHPTPHNRHVVHTIMLLLLGRKKKEALCYGKVGKCARMGFWVINALLLCFRMLRVCVWDARLCGEEILKRSAFYPCARSLDALMRSSTKSYVWWIRCRIDNFSSQLFWLYKDY